MASLTLSCRGQKVITEDEPKTTTVEDKQFDPTGYTAGTIIYSEEENACDYTISIQNNFYYDPVNLKDEFKINGLSVYFKYSLLRMANRCDKANPISIVEILTVNK